MEKKLTGLFDYQKFQGNGRLTAIIDDVDNRYAKALSDDDLEQVNAAGDAEAIQPKAERMTEEEQPLVYFKDDQP